MGLLAPPLACLMVVLSRSPAAWFPWSLPGWWVLGAMVVGTASVLAMDAAQVRKAFPNKERLPGPIGVFCSVACLWVFYYPGYYLERGKFIKPQLGPLALFGVLFALVSLRFMPVQQLPLATSPEMIQEVESAIRLAGLAAGEMTVDGHREVSFDESREIRTGECVVHTGGTSLQVEYHVEWSTDGENPVYVHAWSKELPACSSLPVQTQVQSMLSNSEEFRGLLSLEDWREEWFDATHGRRWGVCRAVLPGWKVPVRFYVEWYDRSEGRFKLTIWTSIPPSCDSETVKSSMSQLLKDRSGAVPAAGVIEQPQDFVEVEFHRETMTRVGEFTGVVGGEQRRVRFQVSEAPPGSEDPYQVVILGIRQ